MALVNKLRLILLLVIALAICAELGWRVADRAPWTENFIIRANSIYTNTGNAEYDPETGWRNRARLRYGSYNTDSHGMRLSSLKETPFADGQILAIGDSFTDNGELRDEEQWSSYLETILGLHVINAGVGGTGADQAYLRGLQTLKLVRPSVIVWDITDLDVARNVYSFNNGAWKPYFTISGDDLSLNNGSPVPLYGDDTFRDIGVVRGVLGYSYAITKITKLLDFNDLVHPRDYSYRQVRPFEDGPEITCRLLAKMKEHATQGGAKFILAITYGASNGLAKERPPDVSAVIDCAAKQESHIVDMWDDLKRAIDGNAYGTMWATPNPPYGHPSAKANKILATRIAELLN